MGFINLLLDVQAWPNGVWETIIGWFFSFIGNYGWTILVFTLALKIVMLPIDYLQRVMTRKTMEQQAILKPQMDALTAKYGNNKDMLNQKQMELYKKEKINPLGSCFGMLISLAVTLFVFITLFSSFNNISHVRIQYEFEQLRIEYENVYILEDNNVEEAQTAVVAKYGEIKEGWLWIQNIWRPDTPWTSVFPSFEEFVTVSGTNFSSYTEETPYVSLNGTEYTDAETAKVAYNLDYSSITAGINTEYSGPNGYLILVILSGVVTFLSQYFATLGAKSKNKKGEDVKSSTQNNKAMLIVLPIVMIVFTVWYSAAFALYILVSSGIMILFNYLINLIINLVNKHKSKDVKVVDYSRK